jgi:hypothetical protein
MRRLLALAAAALIAVPPRAAASAVSGAAFLKIGSGARPAALGEAYTAVANDVDALYYNPGGLARLERPEVGATHALWLLDTTFDFVGYAHPTPAGTFGLGVTRLATGTQEGRSADRARTSGFDASDTAVTASFGRRGPFSGTGLGANLKYLQSRIGSYSATAFAMDFGLIRTVPGTEFSMGASVLNVGRGMRFLEQVDPLPLTFAAGAAYRFAGVLQVAVDFRHEPYDKRSTFGIGTEYALFRGISLRGGYASSVASAGGEGAPLFEGLGAGLGMRLGRYRFDYTLTPFGALGNAQRISIGARF